MSEDMRSAAGEEQALEIASCLRDIPAGKLKVWLDFMKTWSGLSAKDKRSFMDILQMVADSQNGKKAGHHGRVIVPRFPTMQERRDITNEELDEEEMLPGVIVSFHWYAWYADKYKASINTRRREP